MSQLKQLKSIPHRQFPKRQYRKLSYYLYAIIIGIIVIIIILISVAFIIGYKTTDHYADHDHAKSFRIVQKPKVIHHNSGTSDITPKQGEKLLGHWLIKLNYSQNESQRALINYQKSNLIQEKAMDRQLANNPQSDQIKKLIRYNLRIVP